MVCGGSYSRGKVTETTQNTNGRLAVQRSCRALTRMRSLHKISELSTAPSTLVLLCSHCHHNQPMSSTRNNLSLLKTSLSPTRLSLGQNRDWTEILLQTQTNFPQNLQILQFSTYLSRVSWGTLLPPALLLTLVFLLAVMVISAV